MPDEERPKMSNFGKKTTGEDYENPVATWQDIIVISDWEEYKDRTNKEDFYLLRFICPNCMYTVDIAILQGYERPKRFMCDSCHTLQNIPTDIERGEIPTQRWSSDL